MTDWEPGDPIDDDTDIIDKFDPRFRRVLLNIITGSAARWNPKDGWRNA